MMLIPLKQTLIGQSMRRTRMYLSETEQTSVLRGIFVAHNEQKEAIYLLAKKEKLLIPLWSGT